MKKIEELKINKAGFVEFVSRNWGYKGDKGTWVKIEELEEGGHAVTVKYASKGIVSSAYTDEIDSLLDDLEAGFYLYEVPCGSTKSFEVA